MMEQECLQVRAFSPRNALNKVVGTVLNHTPGIAWMRERIRVNRAWDAYCESTDRAYRMPTHGSLRFFAMLLTGFASRLIGGSSVSMRRDALKGMRVIPEGQRRMTQAAFDAFLAERR